jgi:AP-3 complex subunit mu
MPGLSASSGLNTGPAIPWRRSNVRHTSNELYVDILEKISVILAPSGRLISATSSGSIAFTAKISRVPDLLLKLSAPGGSSSSKQSTISSTLNSPVFHPCVRLSRWKEQPGELSFVPPDGRFVLAGYEVDLLPPRLDVDKPPNRKEKIFLPATVDLRTGLGERCSEFEVRLTLNNQFPGAQIISSKPGGGTARSGTSTPSFSFGTSSSRSAGAPVLDAVVVSVPLPDTVRGVADLRPTRGEAHFHQFTRTIEWKVPTKDDASVNGTAVLIGTLVGPVNTNDEEEDDERDENGADVSEGEHSGAAANPLLGYYDEESANVTEEIPTATTSSRGKAQGTSVMAASSSLTGASISFKKRKKLLAGGKALMPRSVNLSFTVRGWLPSGIKVESLVIDAKRSREMSSRVTPYKGVKYVTVSRRGIERRV